MAAISWIHDRRHDTWLDLDRQFFIGHLGGEYVVSRKVGEGRYTTIGRTASLRAAKSLASEHLASNENWPPRKKRQKCAAKGGCK